MTSHRRLNPLTGDWVLVSPHRLARPWLGRTEAVAPMKRLGFDPACYLCPGNARAGNAQNPVYDSTFVFDNDFPALIRPDGGSSGRPGRIENQNRLAELPDLPDLPAHPDLPARPDLPVKDLLISRSAPGVCRVICFSPRHDASLPDLSRKEARAVVDVWRQQYQELGRLPWVRHVQIFENRGAAVGASNPHPHCQVWADAEMPGLPQKEHEAQAHWKAHRGSCLLCDYVTVERAAAERVVWSNATWIVVVPYWAVWPYEVMLLPNRHATGLDRLDDEERDGLAEAIQNVVRRYDRLFDAECPYSMGFHQRPTDGDDHDAWHLHAHYYPPVLRSVAVHKFMVGYELLATPQRDLTPELAARALREAL